MAIRAKQIDKKEAIKLIEEKEDFILIIPLATGDIHLHATRMRFDIAVAALETAKYKIYSASFENKIGETDG